MFGLKEETTRTIHRYVGLVKRLGLDPAALDGLSPEEADGQIEAAIAALRAERPEEDRLFAEPVTVALAGREYEIRPLPIAKDREWRKQLGRVAGEIIRRLAAVQEDGAASPAVADAVALAEAARLAFEQTADREEKDRRLGEVVAANEAVAAAKKRAGSERVQTLLIELAPYIVGDGFEALVDLLFAYSPELRADEERVRNEATSAEFVEAAMGGLTLAFPFVLALVRGGMLVAARMKNTRLPKWG